MPWLRATSSGFSERSTLFSFQPKLFHPKIQSWDSTLYLFENEYAVPLLPPELAAYLGAFSELAFPVLLAVGFCGRFAAFALFVFNLVAVASYPELGPAGIEQHEVWGLMLLVALLHGPGALSLDRLIHRWR